MCGQVSRRSGPRNALRRALRAVVDDRGAVLLLVAGSLVFLLAMAGLALDSGRAYLYRSRLSRAVDAGVLAGARAIRLGDEAAVREALAVARANGVRAGAAGVDLDILLGQTEDGERSVTLTARQPMQTILMHLVGQREVEVASTATAVVPPIDLVLVIDQSGSLADNGAWDDLQAAAKEFVGLFDDDFDRMGLVSFSTGAAHRLWIDHGFTTDIQARIDQMRSAGWTNTASGLGLAAQQITGPGVREHSAKVVVLFTDGRPTAFRGPVGGVDRILAAKATVEALVAAYFDNPDAVPLDSYPDRDGCIEIANCKEWTEGGSPPHGPTAREMARQLGLVAADQIRDAGVYVYTIGLGNPDATSDLAKPDLQYLRQLANENGIVSSRQPAGQSYFAPSPAELASVFRSVAADLLVRLAR